MKFHIPFTFTSIDKIKRKPVIFKRLIKHKKKSKLQDYLDSTDTEINREQYLNLVIKSFLISFVVIDVFAATVLVLLNVSHPYLLALLLAFVSAGFVFFSQRIYPKVFVTRKEKDIEKNLIPALEDMYVQLNAGIPLFSILVNISSSGYGQLSKEFKKAVIRINAGLPQIQVLEDLGKTNPSMFFRRTLWQLSNGMKAGSDISIIIKESVKSLEQEQIIQIQNYGNKLNPLIMFYMLITVILPALAITFLTIIASLVGLSAARFSMNPRSFMLVAVFSNNIAIFPPDFIPETIKFMVLLILSDPIRSPIAIKAFSIFSPVTRDLPNRVISASSGANSFLALRRRARSVVIPALRLLDIS